MSNIIQGRMLIDDFNEAFDMSLHMSDVDTMARIFDHSFRVDS